MNNPISSFLLHQPLGQRHPFDHDPEERFPRQPIAGEPVTLGVKTAAGSSQGSVWVVWQSSESENQYSVLGKWVKSTPDFELWQIDLPAFEKSRHIRYQISAEDSGWKSQTRWFEFDVYEWKEFKRIVFTDEHNGTVSILFGGTDLDALVRLEINQQQSGTLNFNYSFDSEMQVVSDLQDSRNFHLANLNIQVNAEDASIGVKSKDGNFELKSAGYLRVLMDSSQRPHRYEIAFESPADEAFYGFGERYNAVDQRGNSLRNRVIDQYKRQGKRTYYPVPFFLSSRGYGIWVRTDHEITFDMAESNPAAWKMVFEAGSDSSDLEFALMPQGSPAAIIQEFTRQTGRAKLPPSWVFGLWMSSNDWNSQAEVLRQFDLTHQYGIPVTVLVIEAWADEVNFYIWNDAQYPLKPGGAAFNYSDFSFPSGGHWPDPKGMIDTLHAGGTRLILWQIPVLKHCLPEENLDERQNKLDEQYLIENHLCVMEANGEPYKVLSPWFKGSLLPDFTNPHTTELWFKQREYLVKEMGVDGFKTDGGEHIWSDTVQFSDDTRGEGRCNSFVNLYLAAYDHFLESIRGSDKFLFSRTGYTGAQNHPGHWAGDEDSNWEAFRSNVMAMMNLSLSGEPYVGWDMAGFGNEPPGSELYLRSAAMAVFCPIMQYHSEYNARQVPSRDRTPWNIQERSGDDRVIPLFRELVRVRMNLIPYIQSQAWISTQTGIPLMKPLQVEFPGQFGSDEPQFAYLFGKALLVAPVVEEGRTQWQVTLPAGKWRDFWTHAEVEGDQTLTVDVPLGSIPVYQREGTILPLNLASDFKLGSDVGNDTESYRNIELRIFPGEGCSLDLVRGQGEQVDHVAVTCDKDQKEISIDLPGIESPMRVILYTPKPADLKLDGAPAEWSWSEQLRMVSLFVNPGVSRHDLVVCI